MNTRDIATHLYDYLIFLRAEREKASGVYEVTGNEAFLDAKNKIEDRIGIIQDMANELWEMKEKIGEGE